MNENQQNPYNQQPEGEQMPPFAPMPPQMGMPGTVYGAQRQRRPNAAEKAFFPQWLSRNALIVYFLALAVVTFMYSAYSMPWYFMLSGIVAILVFFLYGSTLSKSLSEQKVRREKAFEKRIFKIAFIPRILLLLLLYTIFQSVYGDAFGFEAADAQFYHDLGLDFSAAFTEDHFRETFTHYNDEIDLSDMGYAIYVGFIYWLTGNSIIVVRLIKCVLSSIMVVLMYRLARRNFGEQTGRMAAIFIALWPNFWYYCTAHLKEVEMTFLAVLFVEQADQMLRSRQFTAWKVIPILLIGSALFTVRTPLGLVALLSLVFSIVMTSQRVVSWGKRIVVGVLAIALIGVIGGEQLHNKARGLMENRSAQQEQGLQRSVMIKNGNAYAKYAGAAVFAPMIFTIPFPSMVRPFDGQNVHQFNNGGNFVKNIMSGFTIFALVVLIMSGKWRDHLLPLSMMIGYVIVLTFSAFAQSERFHQPAMPFEFMFAAYGLSIAVTKPKYKRWFTYWSVLMFVAAIGWNWFKLKGRGM